MLENLKYQILKEGQSLAFLSYSKLFKNEALDVQELAKTASAMANAIGGKIYIGLELKNGQVKGYEATPVGFPTPETLEAILKSQLSPRLESISISQENSVLIVEVSESNSKPHMFSNYRYYQRVKSKNLVLEEFQIRQLYKSQHTSDVQIVGFTNLQGIPNMSGGLFSSMKFYPRIHISNTGQKIERVFKLEIKIPSALIDESFEFLHKYLKGYEGSCNLYSIPSSEPLFQGENRIMIELALKLEDDNYEVFEKESLVFRLFSSEKVHTREMLCSEWLHYKGKCPEKINFVKKLNS